jgi:carbonic anhydrase
LRPGPQKWDGLCSTGLFQSPIDLKHSVSHPRSFEPLVFFLYDKEANITLKNNGHTRKSFLMENCVTN